MSESGSRTTTAPSKPSAIPVLLLKTRSQPYDTYEEYFSTPTNFTLFKNLTSKSTSSSPESQLHFKPQFIPVLEHEQNEETLGSLRELLKSGRLKQRYGGMIFTSQRAVEGWADTVGSIESDIVDGYGVNNKESDLNTAVDTRTGSTFTTDIHNTTSFPLYVVGPATARSLETLLSSLHTQPPESHSSPFLTLNPTIHGSQTGSGASLAPFILAHYNALHAQKWYTYHDAPRLPFIPLLGMGSENYSRRRLEPDDPRLQKLPLLFLVGETRRDIIPKTLMDPALKKERVDVDEVEVYRTVVRTEFRAEFEKVVEEIGKEKHSDEMRARVDIVAVVVFSPQGSGDMLRALEFVDEDGNITERSRRRWTNKDGTKYVIVTIGPTTRDHLVNTFGFEPDVCAQKPSPESVGEGLMRFLKEKGLVQKEIDSSRTIEDSLSHLK